MFEFIAGTVLMFIAFVMSTWMFALIRKMLWLANPEPYKCRFHHGMVFDKDTGMAKPQQRPIY